MNLFLIGAAKCGTSSLFDFLGNHPAICPCDIKEPQLFLKDKRSIQQELDNYHSLFPKEAEYYLDASVQYSVPENDGNVHRKIFDYNPQAKIIYIIRNPLHRIESNHWHAYNAGLTSVRDINSALSLNNNLEASRYYRNIQPFIKSFGRKKVLILLYDDLKINESKIQQKLSSFLDLDFSSAGNKIKKINVSRGKKRNNLRLVRTSKKIPFLSLLQKILPSKLKLWVSAELSKHLALKKRPQLNEKNRLQIIKTLKPEITNIEKLIARDLSSWYK